MAQSAVFNNGKKIGLLRGASTRFATWFYAMMRILRLKDALLSTVHQAAFKDLAKTDVIRATIMDITNPKFFKALYVLLRAVFPGIKALRYCDKGEPCMDKIFFLTYRATTALERSKELLNDEELFNFEDDPMLESEAADVYGNASGHENE